jgi:transcriptional regulator GlxA family with amidase domain
VAGRTATGKKSRGAQNERPGADRSQIARGRSKAGNLFQEDVILDSGKAPAAARDQKHVARLDGAQVLQIREGEAIGRDRLTIQRGHPDMQVGCPREKLVRTSKVELGHPIVHGHYYGDLLGHRLFSLFDRLRPHPFDRKVKVPYDSAMNTIGFLLSPGFQLLDFAGPASAFEAANDQLENPAYRLSVLAADEGTVTNSLGIATAAASLNNAALDTLVVVGGRIDPPLSAGTLSRIVEASSRCRRVASVCTGAFILAAAGLLDGRRATTHWRYAPRLQREYPSIRVEADRIFCRDGNVWTSAGITAGIDLALALIEEDHGFAVAKGVAQHLVVYHRRHGGQSQFAASVDLAPKNDRIAAALGYARDHIAEVLTVERLAESAGMSLRQFSRAFRTQTGTTPARVVERLRTDLARGRIETTIEPVERIAEAVGLGDAENMRRAFIRIYGQPPQSIRRTIRH